MDLEIYDSTLRDGSQGEGVNLSVADKLNLTRDLDWLGVAYIEGGWPGSNPKDEEYFAKVPELTLEHAKICAFGSTRRARSGAKDDANLRKLVEARAQVTTIFGKTWDLHVRDALRVSLEDNLAMISDSVAYLASETGRPVFYDAEHFFDGYKANRDYAMQTLQAAHAAGAQRLILCDTNGGGMPWEVTAAVLEVARMLPQARLGIHVHNDGGLAVANTMAAVQAGCIQIQGCMNGVGERCGNVDLTTAIANCELKLGKRCLPEGHLQRLTEVSRTVWERVNLIGPTNQPFVGRSAFAHKGGIHVSAVQRNAATYEHIVPEAVGNTRRILVSELSGRANIQAKLAILHPQIADPQVVASILEDVVQHEHTGYSYEAADGSFDLLVRRRVGAFRQMFTLHHYRIHGLGTEEVDHLVEATVKITVQDVLRLVVAEGHGPVDALSHALIEALLPAYPELKEMHLVDYKVRVVNSADGTAARVRVLIEHRFGHESFGTVGVSENIIQASWIALQDAVEYALNRRADAQRLTAAGGA
jgi:2-isopropylmalate synthase